MSIVYPFDTSCKKLRCFGVCISVLYSLDRTTLTLDDREKGMDDYFYRVFWRIINNNFNTECSSITTSLYITSVFDRELLTLLITN